MYQIDNATAIAVRPAATGAGTAGWFTDGNPGGGVPATILPAEFMNMLMAELMSVLSAGGITLDKTSSVQLLAALRAAGVFQTQATNDSSTKVATTAFANPGASLSANGYQKLPSGLIIQWGTVTTSASADQTVTFPLAFPNACLSVTSTVVTAPAAGTVFCTTNTTPSASSFGIGAWTLGSTTSRSAQSAKWIAIGN